MRMKAHGQQAIHAAGWLTISTDDRSVLLRCSSLTPGERELTQAITPRQAREISIALRHRAIRLEVVDGRRRVVHKLDSQARLVCADQLEDCAGELEAAMTSAVLLMPSGRPSVM